jgi:epoxyqueuosine reductase QueG
MKERLRKIILNLGADVCGVANIDRFEEAPAGFHPRDIFPACLSVVVFGIALPKGLTWAAPALVYGHFNDAVFPEIDWIGFRAARELERLSGGCAVPIPSDGPYEYWAAEKMEGRGLISIRHAAGLAGLGTLGKSSLLINETYGNRLVLGAVLTDANLPSDPPAVGICRENCRLCIENCPSGALDGMTVSQSRCRKYTYITNARGFHTVQCNRCRAVCPVQGGKGGKR